MNRRIGAHGAMLLREIADKRDGRGDAPEASHGIDGSSRVAAPVRRQGLNILTHCNAGSLATAFYGTALGVVYAAAQEGIINRVFADETRALEFVDRFSRERLDEDPAALLALSVTGKMLELQQAQKEANRDAA